MKRPKAPKPTAQQLAVERRQSMALDKEIEEQEERQRALARGQLGTRSLLGGVPRTARERATGGRTAAAAPRTMLGMGGGSRAAGLRRAGASAYGGMNINLK